MEKLERKIREERKNSENNTNRSRVRNEARKN